MTEEELRLKLGLDTTELDSGTRRALQNIGNFGQEAHKSFVHGDNAAKGFKKTLHELSEQIPLLGWSLRALISPMGAAFAGLAIGIGAVTKALDDYNRKSTETANRNAQPISSPPESHFTTDKRKAERVNELTSNGLTPQEAKKQAEAEERWNASKKSAADLVQARKDAAQRALSEYTEHRSKSTATNPEGEPWYKEAAGIFNKVLLVGTGQWTANPFEYTDAKRQGFEAKDAELYHNHLMAQAALKRATDAQAKLEAEKPHAISRGLWGMLGLTNAVGATSRAAVQLKSLLPKFDFDAETGGVKYHGIDNKLLPGALGYVKPSPGAPGYVPGTGDVTKMFDTPVEKLQQQVAVLLMQWGTTGVPVIGKEQ